MEGFTYLANSPESQQTSQGYFFLLTNIPEYIFLEHLIQDKQVVNWKEKIALQVLLL